MNRLPGRARQHVRETQFGRFCRAFERDDNAALFELGTLAQLIQQALAGGQFRLQIAPLFFQLALCGSDFAQ